MKILKDYRSLSGDVIIYTHLGLGDMLIFHGLIRFVIAMTNSVVYVPCKEKYYDSIQFLTRSSSRIRIFRIVESTPEQEQVISLAKSLGLDVLLVGFNSFPPPFTYEKCYSTTGIPFSVSWELFPDMEESETEVRTKLDIDPDPSSEPFALVFPMYSSGPVEISVQSKIRIINVHKTDGGNGIFDWLDLAFRATEIHTTASSFFHFVDRLSLKKCLGNLYLHDIRRDIRGYPGPFRTRHKWNLIG